MKSFLTTDLTPEHKMVVDHYSMLVSPAVAGLADHLRSYIERSRDAFVSQAPEARS